MPAHPTGLGATVASGTDVTLTWTDNSSDETNFVVEKKTGGGSYSTLATKSANVTSHTETGLSPGTYTYRVKATGSPDSAYSNEVRVIIAAPSIDSYTRSGTNASTNFGTATVVDVKWDSRVPNGDNTNRRGYLRFSLTDVLPVVTSSLLRLYGNAVTSAKTTAAYELSDDSWTETGITWSNQPTMGSQLDAQSIPTTAQWNQWTVTDWVQNRITAAAANVNLGLQNTTDSGEGQNSFHSREGVNDPLLVIVSTYATHDIQGRAAGKAGLAGKLELGTEHALAAAIAARAALRATLTATFSGGGQSTPESEGGGGGNVTFALAGAANGDATASAAGSYDIGLTGQAAAQAAGRGSLGADLVIAGQAAGRARTEAIFGREYAIGAVARAFAALAGGLEVDTSPPVYLAGEARGSSGTAGAASYDRGLAGVAGALAQAAAQLDRDVALAAAAEGRSITAGALSLDIDVAAHIAARAALATVFEAGPSVDHELAGHVRAVASATAAAALDLAIAGRADGDALTAGSLGRDFAVAGRAEGASRGAAAMGRDFAMGGQAAGQSRTAGVAGRELGFVGSAAARSADRAGLGIDVGITGRAEAQARNNVVFGMEQALRGAIATRATWLQAVFESGPVLYPPFTAIVGETATMATIADTLTTAIVADTGTIAAIA